MRLFDCFPFFNELELLELRFAILADVVDYFVLVEASKTHTGHDKPFYFAENRERYAPYLDKIIHVTVDDLPDYVTMHPEKAENFQRNCIMRGLTDRAEPGDKIMVSDMDEIPSVAAIQAVIERKEWMYIQHRLYYYYVNVQVNKPCGGTTVADWGTFTLPQQLRRFGTRRLWWMPDRHPPLPSIYPNGGWHYSWLTGFDPDRVLLKAQNIWEAEALAARLGTRDDVIMKLRNLRDILGRDDGWRHGLKVVDVSETKSQALDDWLARYPQFFYRGSGAEATG
jgi:beta-1,4-mannosyl-glycoprotein beta-1,4-N-acetylglucosaminyltransferase